MEKPAPRSKRAVNSAAAAQLAISESLADVALVAAPVIAVAAGESLSSFHAGVARAVRGEPRDGEVPYPVPVIKRPRFTRWGLSEVRAWLSARAESALISEDAARLQALNRPGF